MELTGAGGGGGGCDRCASRRGVAALRRAAAMAIGFDHDITKSSLTTNLRGQSRREWVPANAVFGRAAGGVGVGIPWEGPVAQVCTADPAPRSLPAPSDTYHSELNLYASKDKIDD